MAYSAAGLCVTRRELVRQGPASSAQGPSYRRAEPAYVNISLIQIAPFERVKFCRRSLRGSGRYCSERFCSGSVHVPPREVIAASGRALPIVPILNHARSRHAVPANLLFNFAPCKAAAYSYSCPVLNSRFSLPFSTTGIPASNNRYPRFEQPVSLCKSQSVWVPIAKRHQFHIFQHCPHYPRRRRKPEVHASMLKSNADSQVPLLREFQDGNKRLRIQHAFTNVYVFNTRLQMTPPDCN